MLRCFARQWAPTAGLQISLSSVPSTTSNPSKRVEVSLPIKASQQVRGGRGAAFAVSKLSQGYCGSATASVPYSSKNDVD